jgi:hypothetical protein
MGPAAQQPEEAGKAPYGGSGLKPLAHVTLALVTPVADRVALFQLNRGNRRAEGGVAGDGASQLIGPTVSPTE